MEPQVQTKKIKCPHCGWVRTINIQLVGNTVVDVVAGIPDQALRGVSQALIDTYTKVKDLLRDKELEEANAWIAMPACPNPECKKTYEYNVKTGVTRK